MDVKICDRCGKRLENIKLFRHLAGKRFFMKSYISRKVVTIWPSEKHIELCPSCYCEMKRAYIRYDDTCKRDTNLLTAYQLLANSIHTDYEGYKIDQESLQSVAGEVITLLAEALEE